VYTLKVTPKDNCTIDKVSFKKGKTYPADDLGMAIAIHNRRKIVTINLRDLPKLFTYEQTTETVSDKSFRTGMTAFIKRIFNE